ncbi:hypothetical protein F4860DRAFT_510027 [Xylaria cubensis]|nr:hypothetical protein F4860DRAFT_510027 [Xylaria cubensis]
MVLGQPWAALWLIFWVIMAFYTLELAPPFYARDALPGFRLALFLLCCYSMRWRTEHKQKEASRSKDWYVVHPPDGDHEFPKKEGDEPPETRRGFMRGIQGQLRAIGDASFNRPIFENHILATIYEDGLGTVTEELSSLHHGSYGVTRRDPRQ